MKLNMDIVYDMAIQDMILVFEKVLIIFSKGPVKVVKL